MARRHNRVPPLNDPEVLWVRHGHQRDTIRAELRRLLCRRLKIWAKFVGSGAAAAIAFVQWGTDFADALSKFGGAVSGALHALGLK